MMESIHANVCTGLPELTANLVSKTIFELSKQNCMLLMILLLFMLV